MLFRSHETLGTIERSHRVLNEYLRSYVNENQDNWDSYLKYFCYCYNTTPHVSFNCEFSPYELLFGRKVNIFDFLLDNKIDPVYNFDNYAIQLKYNLQEMHKLASKFLENSKYRNKKIYDKKITYNEFKIGDKILIKREKRQKLDPIYEGPFIIKQIDNVNVVIDKNNKLDVVHKNRIIKYEL